jgi:hypothetical protein
MHHPFTPLSVIAQPDVLYSPPEAPHHPPVTRAFGRPVLTPTTVWNYTPLPEGHQHFRSPQNPGGVYFQKGPQYAPPDFSPSPEPTETMQLNDPIFKKTTHPVTCATRLAGAFPEAPAPTQFQSSRQARRPPIPLRGSAPERHARIRETAAEMRDRTLT